MTDVLDLEMRRRLYALVQAYPGVHLRGAARELDTSVALVEYHAKVLVDAGLLREDREGHTVRLFAAEAAREPTEQESEWLRVLRLPLPLRVTLALLDEATPVRHGELAQALGLGKSTLTFQLRKLESAGIAHRTADGAFAVTDRARTVRTLLTFPPTPSLQEEFADLWDAIYGASR